MDAQRVFPPFTLTLEATVFTSAQLRAWLGSLAGAAQIALAGRSNVGKSSLINALGQRRQLAKTSATPGKTRSINVYRVAPQGFVLSDLPGYGYARCGREEQRRWAELIETYLRHGGVNGLALLLDCRIPPQQSDRDLADFARAAGLPLLPLLTKADKCSQAERNRRQHEWKPLLDGLCPLAVSARNGLGLDEARRRLCALAAGEGAHGEDCGQSMPARSGEQRGRKGGSDVC